MNNITPSTPITPVKIEKFNEFLSFMSTKRIDLNSIQFGTLNNGIFEKSEVDANEKTNDQYVPAIEPPPMPHHLHIKRYNSSYN
jgi:hypothetical protein